MTAATTGAINWIETDRGLDAHAFTDDGRFIAVKDTSDFGGPRRLLVFVEAEQVGRRIEATYNGGRGAAEEFGGELSIYDLHEVKVARSYAAAKRWAERNYARIEL